MHDDLEDVLSAAVNNGRPPTFDAPIRQATQLRTVGVGHPSMAHAASVPLPLPDAPAAVPANHVADEGAQLSRRALRLGFWLCGFQDALVEREQRGELLTERESSLLELSRNDFAEMRPLVITMAVKRLDAVVTSPGVRVDAGSSEASADSPMEAFALDTIRNLSARANQLLQNHGPDMAIAMFGGTDKMMEPLAIFRTVFATALAIIEAFERMVPSGTKFLPQLAAALDSELERV